MLLNQSKNDYFKTGTLNGIRTRAGYLVSHKGQLYPYVIMINKSGTTYNNTLRQLHILINQKIL